MSIEQRNGRLYQYTARRVHGRVVKEYLGPVPPWWAAGVRDQAEQEKAKRKTDRAQAFAAAERVVVAGVEFDQLADKVFRSTMHVLGYRLHHRGEWRHKQGSTPMATLESMSGTNAAQKLAPALITPHALDPSHRKTLDRAANGDCTVVRELVELFKDPRYLDMIGRVEEMARWALINQAGGANVAVLVAVERKFNEYVQRLHDDSPEAPTFAERLAVTRVAHNWLAVHILECLMNKCELWSDRSAALDKALYRADRRLNASLKTLAVLRRLRKPKPAAQVNVSVGSMVVNGGTK